MMDCIGLQEVMDIKYIQIQPFAEFPRICIETFRFRGAVQRQRFSTDSAAFGRTGHRDVSASIGPSFFQDRSCGNYGYPMVSHGIPIPQKNGEPVGATKTMAFPKHMIL